MKHDRRLAVAWPDTTHLRARLMIAEPVIEREVPVSKRKTLSGMSRIRHPPRSKRIARLVLSAVPVTFAGADYTCDDDIRRRHHTDLPSITTHAVRVVEVDPPDGEEPIEWILLTSEPISTLDEISSIVDAYRARWVVEELFKSLKTGCGIEKRQLESKHALMNILAVSLPIAWRLLRLRDVGREQAPHPASDVVSKLEIAILQVHQKVQMPAIETATEAMLAVAKLGGHLK